MRAFILLLILLNILFYLWGEYIYNPPTSPITQHIPDDIYKLELASELTPRPIETEKESEEVPPSAQQATDTENGKEEAPLAPEIAEVPKKAEEGENTELVETTGDENLTNEAPTLELAPGNSSEINTEVIASKQSTLINKPLPAPKTPLLQPRDKCFTVGPFETNILLDSAIDHLAEQGINPTLRTLEEQEVSSYRVFIPPTDHSEILNTSINTLRKKGFKEFYVMTEAGMESAISLGLFRERINASKQMKRLKSAGLAPKLKTRYRDKKYHWLDYKDNNNLIKNSLLESWFPGEALQLLPGKCE